tara:strand:- start:984 stop:1331 length:348 start_codon:yes stop_codon:yes gene_type:complete
MKYPIPYSVKTELLEYIHSLIDDGELTKENKDDWLLRAFTCMDKTLYMKTHHHAIKWLEKHELNPFHVIEIVEDFEYKYLNNTVTRFSHAAQVVNNYIYICGECLINDLGEVYEN